MAQVLEQHGKQRTMSILSFSKNRKNRKSMESGFLYEENPTKPPRKQSYDPNPAAIYGAQPDTTLTLGSIRDIKHRDAKGDIIADPDLSNPTRSRLERPLATIMSFHAAVDGSYGEKPFSRTDTQFRRHSYYHGHTARQRPPGDAGVSYGNRMSPRPDSYIDNYASQNQSSNMRRPAPRANSDPVLYGNNNQNNYPLPAYSHSYDTGGSSSANESHGTDQWGNFTDPSSENSSIDRAQQAPKPDLGEVYGFNGFGGAPQFQGPILEEHGQGAPTYGQPGYGQVQTMPGRAQAYQGNEASTGPTPPTHNFSTKTTTRKPIELGNSATTTLSSSPSNKKRMSWIQRRFSTKGKRAD